VGEKYLSHSNLLPYRLLFLTSGFNPRKVATRTSSLGNVSFLGGSLVQKMTGDTLL
jgi:hypothetical protein